ncbi:MAG TPA: hypothetical protein VM869_20775, partial [Enhygromyxa sp.]|nr:hypothetical protein [Enhygromyxa sp.]
RTRYAGPWAYELPERFSDPRVRTWTDGDSLRVQLRVAAVGDPPLQLDALIDRELEPGRTQLARDDRPLANGELAHLHQRGSLDLEWSAYVAVLRLDGAREVAIVATAPWPEDATLGRIVDALIATVEVRP